jgi:hypothetical protein
MECAKMQSRISRATLFVAAAVFGCAVLLFAQEVGKPNLTISGAPSEPLSIGTCEFSTFGYIEIGGRRADFDDAKFGKEIKAALLKGYVLTIYPPTKSGIFVNQECRGAANRAKVSKSP